MGHAVRNARIRNCLARTKLKRSVLTCKVSVTAMVALGTCLAATEASASGTQTINDIVNSAVQAAVQNARDQAFANRNRSTVVGPGVAATFLGGPGDPTSPSYVRAASRASPYDQAAIWGSVSYDYERTDLAGAVATSRAWAELAGVDWTHISRSDVVLYGLLGGGVQTSSTAAGVTADTRTAVAGAYAAYIAGNFSTDFAYTRSWSFATVDSISDMWAGNVQYRFMLAANCWWEPTAGFTYTIADTKDLLPSVETWRIQGGARAGTTYNWGGVTVEPTVTGLLYSDVSIRGVPAGAATDEGQLWGKAIGKLNFTWSPKFSTYIQGEWHGTDGTEKNTGYIGTVGGRLQF